MRFHPRDFEEARRPLSRVNRLFGLRLFEYSAGQYSLIFGFLYVGLLTLFFCSGFFTGAFQWRITLPLQLANAVGFLTARIVNALVFSHVVLGLFNSKAFRDCSTRIKEIDKSLLKLGAPMEHGQTYSRITKSLVIWCAVMSVRLIFFVVRHFNIHPQTSLLTILYYWVVRNYSEFLGGFIALDFALTVLSIRDRFLQMNHLLNKTTGHSAREVGNTSLLGSKWASKTKISTIILPGIKMIRRGRTKQLIVCVRQVHLELSKVSGTLSRIFGLQLALEISRSVIMVIVILYRLYSQWRLQFTTTFMQILDHVWIFFMCLLHSSKFVIVHMCSYKAAIETNKTAEVIHGMSGSIADPQTKEELRQFGLQMLLCPVKFTAYGLFDMDCNSIRGILSAVTTYLVILIQIGDAIEYSNGQGKPAQNRTTT